MDVELTEARNRADRERQASGRARRFAVALAVALVLALVTAVMATYYQRSAAERAGEAAVATTAADANRLSALSTTVGGLDLSLLLAAQAARLADTPATRAGLLTSLVTHRRATQVGQLGQRPVDAELADDGRTLMFSSDQGLRAWRVGSRARVHLVVDWQQPDDFAASPTQDVAALWAMRDEDTPEVGVFAADGTRRLQLVGEGQIGGWPSTFGFSPDGRRLLMMVRNSTAPAPGHRGTIREIDIASGRVVRSIPALRSHDPDVDVWATFADDGSSAVVWTEHAHPRAALIDLSTGRRTRMHLARRSSTSVGLVPLPTAVAQRWADGAVTLYDARGRQTQVLDVHRAQVNDLVMAPDGSWAASVDELGAVIVWDVDRRTGEWTQRESLVGPDGAVTAVAVTPQGDDLVTVSRDGKAITWDLSRDAGFGSALPGLGDRRFSNTPQTVVPGRLAVAPTRPELDDEYASESALEVEALFLEPRTGRVVDRVRVGRTVPGTRFGSSVSVSPDASKVAVTYGYGTLVLDARTRKVLARIVLDDVEEFGEHRPEIVWCTEWSSDGSKLLIGAEGLIYGQDDGGLVVVDTETWKPAEQRVDLGGSAQTMARSGDGRWLAVGMTIPAVNDPPPSEVRILDARTLALHQVLRLRDSAYPFDVAFSPDSRLLAVGGDPGTVSVFDLHTGRTLHRPSQVHTDIVQQLSWLPDNRTLITSGGDGMVTVYDARQGLVLATLPGSSDGRVGYTYLTSVSADAISAFTGSRDGREYSLDVARWLDYACVVAGRDLTRDEWSIYLPNREYQQTCGDHARS
ncbi:hypothetical protein BH10ACT10_BH10ACT10_12070 [soil metagenome]